MIGRKLTGTLVALAFVAIPATPSQAFCHLFGRCKQPTTTFYAPVAPAPVVVAPMAPTCCPQPTVVNYMPQTAFRSVIVNRPVVTMMPEAGCDACGRPTTVMRPVTTFVAQQQLVPYTTFRPVAVPVAQPCCGAAPVTVGFAPAVTAVPMAAPAPAPAAPCCGATATPVPSLSSYPPATVVTPAPAPAAPCCGATATPTPSLSGYSPAPATPVTPVTPLPANNYTPSNAPSGTPGSTLQSLQPTPDPSLNAPPQAAPSTSPNSTFAPNGNSTPSPGEPQPQSRILLPPSTTAPSATSNRPHGLDPEDNGDRTTAIPLRGYSVRQASLIVPIQSSLKAEKPATDDGWRPAAE